MVIPKHALLLVGSIEFENAPNNPTRKLPSNKNEIFSLSYLPCKNQESVGIDLRIKTLAVLSNGSFFESPRPCKKN